VPLLDATQDYSELIYTRSQIKMVFHRNLDEKWSYCCDTFTHELHAVQSHQQRTPHHPCRYRLITSLLVDQTGHKLHHSA